MKVTELIAELTARRERHGDVDVFVDTTSMPSDVLALDSVDYDVFEEDGPTVIVIVPSAT